MATKVLELVNLTASAAADDTMGSGEVEELLKQTKWEGKSLSVMQAADPTSVVVDKTNMTITVKGLGVLSFVIKKASGVAVTLNADAALAGSVDFKAPGVVTTASTGYTFDAINLSKTTAGLTTTVDAAATGAVVFVGGSGDDKVTLKPLGATTSGVIVGGAGNDTLIIGGAAGTKVGLTGGLGADTFNVAAVATAGVVVINDYTYAQGDVILGSDGAATLGATGEYYVSATGLATTSTIAKADGDGLYKIKVADKNGKKAKEYWTVADGGYTAVKADGSGIKDDMVLTATSSTRADTLIGGAGNDTIFASSAAGSIIWAGAGNDSIKLGGDKKGTVWFGSMDGNDTLIGYGTGATVINLYDSTVSDLTVATASDAYTFSVGSSKLTVSAAAAATATVTDMKFQEKGGAVKTASFDVNGGQTIKVVKDSNNDVYVGKVSDAGKWTTVDYATVGATDLTVNLYDTAKYKNIAGIVAAASAADAVYIGAQDKATTIDASAVNAAATGMQIWGGGAHNDSIVLDSASAAAQTVWFGAGDGNDTIGNFTSGVAASADVVYLYDTADLTTVGFASNGAGTDIKIGNAVLHVSGVNASAAGGVQLLLKDSASKVNKVAVSTAKKNGTVIADGADYTFAASENATVEYTAATTDDIVVNLMDTAKYKNITNIAASATSAGVTAIGTGTGSRIALGSGTNAVWGGGAGNDTIVLNSGKTEVWYGGAFDGGDDITGFAAANDSVYFWDASLQDVVRNAAFSGGDGAEVGLKFSDKNRLNIAGTDLEKGIRVKDNTGATTKMMVDVTDQGMTFKADTKAYVSTAKTGGKLTIDAGEGDVTLYLDNIYATTGNTVNDIYLKGITKLDATKGFANYVLIGGSATTDELTGGKGTTAMWGGGAASDKMIGGSGVDTVWFGSGDGADLFEEAGAEDKVILWNTTQITDLQATYGTDGALTISTTGGDKLVITSGDEAKLGQLTFQVGTDDATSLKYTFDTKAKAFKAK